MPGALEWSAAKQRLFRLEANTVVSAAAGSGKTTALVELYLRLLEGLPPDRDGPGGLGPGDPGAGGPRVGGLGPDGRPLEPEEVAVVTFTEKAAQDLTRKIREGLLARLEQAQARPDPPARRTQSARWEEARARLEAAPIGTIHHYAARLLREHPVEAGVDPGFEVLDETDAGALRREAGADVVRDALDRRDAALVLLLGHVPLADQGEYRGLESSLVDALSRLRGAGTSVEQLRRATRARLAELDADRMRLAADLEAAAATLRSVPAARPFLAAWDALPEAARRLAPDLDDAAWQPLLALPPLAKSWRGAGSRDPMRRVLADALDELPALFSQRAAMPLGDAFLDLLARVEGAYETRKQRRRALDFDDLEEGAVRLLRRDRDAGGTLLASRPAAVLVDEFQDNNRRQLELVRLLAGDGAGRLRDRALVVVGDPKQSIYRFRGADVSVFRRITDLVAGDAGGAAGAAGTTGAGNEASAGNPTGAGGGAGPLRFAESFRSVPGIITFVNALFARYMGPPDPARPPYEVPFGPEDALEARRPDAAGGLAAPGCGDGSAGEAVGGAAGAAGGGGAGPAGEPSGVAGAGPTGEPGGAGGAAVERAIGAAVEGSAGAAAGAAAGRGVGAAPVQAAGVAGESGSGAAGKDGPGAPVELICLPVNETGEVRRVREAEAAVRRIRRLVAEGFRPGQIAVLLRTLKHAPPLQRGLEAAGVPAYVVKGSGFFGAAEVRDVLCLLASLDSPLDDLALAAVLRSPFAGVSDDALLLLARPDLAVHLDPAAHADPAARRDPAADPDPGARSDSAAREDPAVRPYAAARPRPLHRAFRRGRLAPPVPPLPEADRARLDAFAAWHHELRARKDRTPLPELIEEALERSGYAAACLTRAGGDQQLANLRKLVEQARAFEARPGRTLRDFVRELERAVSEEPRETAAQVAGEGEDVVRILTIHAAKGLEFPVVVLPGCADRMPDDTGPVVLDEDPDAGGLALRPADPTTLEPAPTWLARRLGEARRRKARAEWRRLFYVAATRARDRLILVGEHPVKKDGSPWDADTWRREVDALLEAQPELAATGVVRRVRWEELGEAAAPVATEATGAPALPDAPGLPGAPALPEAPEPAGAPDAAVEDIVKRVHWRPARPTRFVHTATELAELAACPHRYYLTRRLGLADGPDPWFDGGDEPQEDAGGESGPASGDGGEQGAPARLRPLDRGSLAHAVLEHVPLGLGGVPLASCVRELVREHAAALPGGVRGRGGASGAGGVSGTGGVSGAGGASGARGVHGADGAPGVGGVSGADGAPGPEPDDLAFRITAFLEGPTGRELRHAWRVDPDRVLREYPFVMRLADGGATLVVHGKIDLLWQDDGGAWSVIDYKTARGEGEDAVRRYELQLLTYALAAGRLAGAPVSRAGLVFLLGDAAEPVWLDAGPRAPAGLEARAVALARRLGELEQEARDAEGWPRIALPDCRRLGCGFVRRCYGWRGREGR